MTKISMNEEPLISIIVPVYNTEEYLTLALSSLCSQTYKNIEIICVDDGSTDNSLKILEKFRAFDSRIKIIKQKHQGVSVARNKGLDKVTGKYIAFVDSDDYVKPEMFEVLYKTIKKYDTDVVLFNYYNLTDEKCEIHPSVSDFLMNEE